MVRKKLLGRDELAALLKRERQQGRTVVFTNGCFDLLHAGHVRYLAQARALGDLLVVGVNSDESVSRLKGPGRPLNPQEDRAEVLAALECVDYVVIFEEDTPAELIEALKPQVQVKGGDYRPEEVPEQKVLEAFGGRLEIVDLVPGRSTTELIRRIEGLSR